MDRHAARPSAGRAPEHLPATGRTAWALSSAVMRRLAALFFLVGCTKATPSLPAAIDASVAVAVTVDAAPALSPDDDVRRVVRAWSDALDRHDVDALGALYADNVFFYTSVRTKAQVLAAKTSALGPTSTFHQQIVGDIAVTNGRATFTKRSGNGTKLASGQAVLVVAGSPLAITEERDAPRPPASCEAAVMDVVDAIPAVKKQMDDIRKNVAKTPDANLGGIRTGARRRRHDRWSARRSPPRPFRVGRSSSAIRRRACSASPSWATTTRAIRRQPRTTLTSSPPPRRSCRRAVINAKNLRAPSCRFVGVILRK